MARNGPSTSGRLTSLATIPAGHRLKSLDRLASRVACLGQELADFHRCRPYRQSGFLGELNSSLLAHPGHLVDAHIGRRQTGDTDPNRKITGVTPMSSIRQSVIRSHDLTQIKQPAFSGST
jgi:hypothetical protein